MQLEKSELNDQSMLQVYLKKTQLTVQAWNQYLAQCPDANWMQSWPYAKAAFLRDFKSLSTYIIYQKVDRSLNQTSEECDQVLGVFLIQSFKWSLVQSVELYRGPLWLQKTLDQFDQCDLIIAFAQQFVACFPRRLLHKRRWLPEFYNLNSNGSLQVTNQLLDTVAKLQKTGLKLRKETYFTSRVDLTKPLIEIKKNMHQKWRNCFNKSLVQNLILKEDYNLKTMDSFLDFYDQFKLQKKFNGPTSAFMMSEALAGKDFKMTFLLWAYVGATPSVQDNESYPDNYQIIHTEFNQTPIAGIWVAIHGQIASYRIGWNSLQGRKLNAHAFLLWKAIELLKLKNIHFFDLGGLLPKEAPELTSFKMGVGGQNQVYLGMFE